ncbi:MAG: Rrf2 family transcriptional regulator [Aerococcus sp.]|nr:Rrf2 family transcriptional regulator [Aerococcus sp.]
MNLYFNIAIHVLTFLLKHAGEQFTSEALAELICVNPVQLRNVMRELVAAGYVSSKKGKAGGYAVSESLGGLPLSELFDLFRQTPLDVRVITGRPDSHCEIARNIGDYLAELDAEEHELLKQFYATRTLQDVLASIEAKEQMNETV